ncbi:hypothetical protein AB3N02_22670 [Priestia aryabhattai]|uniref:hypothetical protein n=1 Tax=Priestia aryabhattai TaxID=412384 RepID=UPI0039A29DA4
MSAYNIGDIVTYKVSSGTIEYYIITDMEDYSFETADGEFIKDIDYQIAMIYPVHRKTKFAVVDEEVIKLVAKETDQQYSLIFDLINKERDKRMWLGKPDYMVFVETNKVANQKKQDGSLVATKYGWKEKEKDLDVIKYHELKTVDDCLDAMNDLTALHKNFGDEAYIQLKEFVMIRLKELV